MFSYISLAYFRVYSALQIDKLHELLEPGDVCEGGVWLFSPVYIYKSILPGDVQKLQYKQTSIIPRQRLKKVQKHQIFWRWRVGARSFFCLIFFLCGSIASNVGFDNVAKIILMHLLYSVTNSANLRGWIG